MRLFVSVAVPATAGIIGLFEDMRHYSLHPVSTAHLHLTLAFIGEVEKVGEIDNALREAVSGFGTGKTVLSGLGAFPNNSDPHVLWVGVRGDMDYSELAGRVRSGLRDAGIHFDGKPFKPHLTVARPKAPVSQFLFGKYGSCAFGEFVPSTVDLMKSELTPTGPRYTVMRRYGLVPDSDRPVH